MNSTNLLTSTMETRKFLWGRKAFYILLLLGFSAFESSSQYSAASPCPNPSSSLEKHFPKSHAYFFLFFKDSPTLILAYYRPKNTSIVHILQLGHWNFCFFFNLVVNQIIRNPHVWTAWIGDSDYLKGPCISHDIKALFWIIYPFVYNPLQCSSYSI